MKLENVFDIAQELKGMPVVMQGRGQKLGQVVDALVHPTEGVVQALVMATVENRELAISIQDCAIYGELGAILVTPEVWEKTQQPACLPRQGVRVCAKLLGIEVITQNGKSLGQVVAVYATEDRLRTIYRVATTWLHFFVRGGVFLPGDLPVAWLEKGARLIVPADTMEHESFSSLHDTLKFV